ncbi:hypothetical protein [Chlamydia vaughanii]|uniref:hypothetical protein n=1 Tax=Chlamydia vaughanii TaxID=3112552 RepID=UPI0032B0F8F8
MIYSEISSTGNVILSNPLLNQRSNVLEQRYAWIARTIAVIAGLLLLACEGYVWVCSLSVSALLTVFISVAIIASAILFWLVIQSLFKNILFPPIEVIEPKEIEERRLELKVLEEELNRKRLARVDKEEELSAENHKARFLEKQVSVLKQISNQKYLLKDFTIRYDLFKGTGFSAWPDLLMSLGVIRMQFCGFQRTMTLAKKFYDPKLFQGRLDLRAPLTKITPLVYTLDKSVKEMKEAIPCSDTGEDVVQEQQREAKKSLFSKKAPKK